MERLGEPDLFAGEDATRLGPPIGLLTGSTPARERRDVLARLAAGELRLLVGTHALIQDAVGFERLALAVVDEQHRFGVRQRTALDKAVNGRAPRRRRPRGSRQASSPTSGSRSCTARCRLARSARRWRALRGARPTCSSRRA